MNTDVALFGLAVLAVVVIVVSYHAQGKDKPCKKCIRAEGRYYNLLETAETFVKEKNNRIKKLERDNQNLMTGKEYRNLKIDRLEEDLEDLAKCQAELEHKNQNLRTALKWKNLKVSRLEEDLAKREDEPIKIGGSV